MMTIGFELEFLMPAEGCPSCEGNGYTYCPTCEGDGYVECTECEGYGRVNCLSCDGEGYINENGNIVTCPDCEGAGSVECFDCDGTGSDYCPECDGTGRVDCLDCSATGYITNDGAVAEQLEEYGADVGYDSSVRCYCEEDEGRELRSPVFDFSDKERLYDFIHTVTSIIRDGDGESSPDLYCGLHVHVCPTDGWTQHALKKLYRAWINWAEKMFIEHFRPATWRLLDYARRWTNWLSECSSYEHELAIKGEIYPGYSRYMTLNVRSLYDHGTIEFRLFDGTLDPCEIKEALTWVGTLTEALLLYDDPDEIKKYFEAQLGIVQAAA